MIRYTFTFDEDTEVVFEIAPECDTSQEEKGKRVPAWTRLDRHRCPACTLPRRSRRSCPAALALVPLVKAFEGMVSFHPVQVSVSAHGIDFNATMDMQLAVRSVMGVTLAQSSCPVLSQLRPMAHYHLPFASEPHATFRYMGMYLIAQFLRQREGLAPDWELTGLNELIEQVHQVNTMLAKRLRDGVEGDATINSVICLDVVAHFVQVGIDQWSEELRPLFLAYLKDRADR